MLMTRRVVTVILLMLAVDMIRSDNLPDVAAWSDPNIDDHVPIDDYEKGNEFFKSCSETVQETNLTSWRTGGDGKDGIHNKVLFPCEPSIGEVVEAEDNARGTNCQRFFACNKDHAECQTPDTAGNVASKGKMLFTMDPMCKLSNIGNSLTLKTFRRFRTENLNAKNNLGPKYFFDLKANQLTPALYGEATYYFSGQDSMYTHNIKVDMSNGKPCGDSCYGYKDIVYPNTAENTIMRFSIFVNETCPWLKLCFAFNIQQGTCESYYEATILFKHKFVVLPGAKRGTKMRFFKSGQNTSVLHFEKTDQRVWMTNAFKQTVVGAGFMQGVLSVHTDEPDKCYIDLLGIKNDGSRGVGYNPTQEVPNVELSNATVAPHDNTAFTGSVPPALATTNKLESAPETEAPSNNEITTANAEPSQSEWDILKDGWWTWAVLAGFVAGSGGTLLLGGIVLYVGRRSIYADWYRGMYKRYGSDASMMTGMTMNSEFNTTGAMTVGNSTMMNTRGGGGGTTMGGTTTGGSTMGTTDGGGTTTGGGGTTAAHTSQTVTQ